MDVIGVGFGRTGTLSLKAALERLGALCAFLGVEAPQGEPFPTSTRASSSPG